MIAKSVDVIIDRSRRFACAARGNDGDASVLLNNIANVIGIVSLVGNQDARARLGIAHYEVEALIVRDFAAGDLCPDREALCVGAEMDFGREATF